MKSLILVSSIVVLVLACGAAEAQNRSPSLGVVETITLQKASGTVNEVVPGRAGGWLVRDSTDNTPSHQRVESYDPRGHLLGTVGSYGHGPTKYLSLADIERDRSGRTWIADFGTGRLLRFAADGVPSGSILLQNPSYRPKAFALDEEHGRLFVAGCYPTKEFLDRGCLLVHQYDADGEFVRSMVETHPEIIAKRWAGRSGFDLTVADDGQVFFVHEARLALLRIDPQSGKVDSFDIESDVARAVPTLSREQVMNTEAKNEAMAASFRIGRVVAEGDRVLVSIRRPGGGGSLLAMFDSSGRQIARDLEAPGRLVGGTGDGRWIFADSTGEAGTVLSFATIR